MIKLIVAYDENRGIGANNEIPWFIMGELKWVAETTKLVQNPAKINALIMGKNTWLSLPKSRRPLPDRLNIVISTSLKIEDENVMVFSSFDEAIKFVNESDHIETGFIFGGSSIYQQALDANVVDQVLATEVRVKNDYTDNVFTPKYEADIFFPSLPDSFVGFRPDITKYGEDQVTRITFSNQR